MDHAYARDAAMSALILGFFASSWFRWAQERPPNGWRRPLAVAAVTSVVVAASGGLLAWQSWSAGSALSGDGAMRAYGVMVGVEFALAAVGAVLLVWRGQSRYLAPFICFVVGVHFWPMAPLLEEPGLYLLGGVLVAVAAGAVLLSRRTSILSSALTGAGAGTVLFLFALRGAISAVL